jgi:hypothetical protein
MNKINLEKFLNQIIKLSTFYSYCKGVFENENIRDEIKEQEANSMYNTAKSIKSLKISAKEFVSNFKGNIESNVDKYINEGIDILRQQILVSAFSIFENYLSHVVKIYLNVFPTILKESKKSIDFKEIVDLKDNNSIFQHIITKEVIYFDRMSLEKKKKYLTKKLKLTKQDDLWKLNGKELWKEINNQRDLIVHSDELIELNEEQLSSYLIYFERIMFGMTLYAKIDQGVDFIWEKFSEQIPGKEIPTLK